MVSLKIFAGNSNWVHAMEWSGQKAFGASSTIPFKVGGAEAGLLKSHGPLSFLKVTLSFSLSLSPLSLYIYMYLFPPYSSYFL
jgi:hypothetical protein